MPKTNRKRGYELTNIAIFIKPIVSHCH